MTWTLCSVTDPLGVLSELRRVLRPNGTLLFIEHGQASDSEPAVQRWQDGITPIWRCLTGNCHPNRRIDRLLTATGFATQTLTRGYLTDGPKMLTYHYQGRACVDRQPQNSATDLRGTASYAA